MRVRAAKHLEAVSQHRDSDPGDNRTTPVPKELVHKSAAAAVLLLGAEQCDENRFAVATRWPTAGPTYRADVQGTPVLLSEVMRQTAIYLSHRFYGVTLGHQFILSGLDLDFQGQTGNRPSAQAAQVEVAVTVATRTPRRFSASLDATVRQNGHFIGSGTLRWLALEHSSYTRLRSRDPGASDPFPAPGRPHGYLVEAESVGCSADADVLLATAARGVNNAWDMVLDTGHPGHFDHPLDHVPGIAVIEAFRQAGYAWVRHSDKEAMPMLSNSTSTFTAFGSLTAPVSIDIKHSAEVSPCLKAVELTASQFGGVIASNCATWVADGAGRSQW